MKIETFIRKSIFLEYTKEKIVAVVFQEKIYEAILMNLLIRPKET